MESAASAAVGGGSTSRGVGVAVGWGVGGGGGVGLGGLRTTARGGQWGRGGGQERRWSLLRKPGSQLTVWPPS